MVKIKRNTNKEEVTIKMGKSKGKKEREKKKSV